MPTSPAFTEFERPRRAVTDLPSDVSEALMRFARPRDPAPRPDPRPFLEPDTAPYFEIYRGERVSLTSILFSGEDWRWRFCSASGEPIAVSGGYSSERSCAAAVASLRNGAGGAEVRPVSTLTA